MTDDNGSIKIGELLCQVGVLTTGDLTEAIQISKRMGVPIGRVLVMSGCVNETNLQSALEAQSLIRDKLLEVDLAVKALGKVFKEGTPLKEALKSFDWQPKPGGSNKLGEILLDSNIVSKDQLEKALQASFHSGMPLGGTLVLQGVLSAQLLPTILHAQDEIRAGRMTREEAVEQLKTAVMYWAKAHESKSDEYLQTEKKPAASVPPVPPVPALSPGSGFSSPAPPPGQASFFSSLPQQAYAAQPSPPQPPSYPPQQPGVPNPYPEQSQQGGFGRQAAQWSPAPAPAPSPQPVYSPQQAVMPPGQPGTDGQPGSALEAVSLLELLKLSAVCTQSDIQAAVDRALQNSESTGRLLLMLGLIDQPGLDVFTRCQGLVGRGVLRKEQALFVLSAMRYRGLSFEDALQELGISAPGQGIGR